MAATRLANVLTYLRSLTPAPDDDCALLRRYTDTHDGPAFTALVQRHGPLVYGVCRRLLGDSPAADDALQATFVLLARKAKSLRRPAPLGPWLYGVARRVALRARQSKRRFLPLTDRAQPGLSEQESYELRDALDDAIRRLPGHYRTTFLLCHIQGLTNAEAARQLRCPLGTIAARLSRARALLRTRLLRQGLALPASLLVGLSPTLLGETVTAAVVVAPPAAVVLVEGVLRTMLAKKLAFGGAVSTAAFFGLAVWPGERDGGRVSAQPPVEVVPLVNTPIPIRNFGDNTVQLANANFIVSAHSVEIANQIAETAERLRQSWGIYLFNAPVPTWKEPCAVRVKLNANGGTGATEFTFAEGKVARMKMTLTGTYERILHSALPHEIVHTLLADAIGKPLPRWLDEGLASQADSRDEQIKLLQRHSDAHKAGRLLPLQQLLELREYPRDVQLFYAQSYSLTRFLIDQKGLPPLLAFARADLSQGVDAAVNKNFGYPDVASLESAWLKGPPLAKAPDIRPRAIGTAPSCGRAKMLNDHTIGVTVEEEQIDQTTRSASGVFAMPERRVVRYVHPLRLADVTAMRGDGRELAQAELRALLQTEQPVLMIDQELAKVDPTLFALLRPEALVIRLASVNLHRQRFPKP